MKKLFLAIMAVAASGISCFADTSLADAYNALSDMSGMTEEKTSQLAIAPSANITDVKVASVSTCAADSESYRDNFIYMMENLPVRNMVVGANNQRELMAIYSTPAAGGQCDVLIVTGNTPNGDYSVAYGKATPAVIEAIQSCQITMDPDVLVLSATPTAQLLTLNE